MFEQELLDGDVLEVGDVVVGVELRDTPADVYLLDEHPESELVVQREVRIGSDLPDLLHRVDDAVDVVGVGFVTPLQVLAESQFLDQFDDCPLGRREVVVELLDGVTGSLVDGR